MELDRAVMCRVTGGRTTGAMEDGTRTRQPTHTVGGVFVHRSEGLDIESQRCPTRSSATRKAISMTAVGGWPGLDVQHEPLSIGD
jgi:hypothetical protein